MRELVEEINGKFDTEFALPSTKVEITNLIEILNFLDEKRVSESIGFVHRKGKRKTLIQKYIETIKDAIEKQNKYDSFNNTFSGRNSFSKTDKDATFMKMKEDHMRNSQLKPGYNMNKFHNRTHGGRCGISLHEIKVS